MSLFHEIIAAYPDLTTDDFHPRLGSIALFDDGDGIEYIGKWEYAKPIPKGLKLGK